MAPELDPRHPNGELDELRDRRAAVDAPDGDAPPDPEAEPPPEQPKPGRDAGGRFVRGNSGGPGNPFARQVASFREALYEAVGRDMLKDLACRLWGLAMGGNVAAARLLLQYLIGKPQDPPNPDRVDRDEWQAYQSDAVPGQEFNRLMASMPVPMAVHLAQGVWPIVAEYMIRRPMADMFKDPAEKEAKGKAEKRKHDECGRREPPTANGGVGAEPPTSAGPTADAVPATPRAADEPPSQPPVHRPSERRSAAVVGLGPTGDRRQQTAANGGSSPAPGAPAGGPAPRQPHGQTTGAPPPHCQQTAASAPPPPRQPAPDPRPPSTNGGNGPP